MSTEGFEETEYEPVRTSMVSSQTWLWKPSSSTLSLNSVSCTVSESIAFEFTLPFSFSFWTWARDDSPGYIQVNIMHDHSPGVWR